MPIPVTVPRLGWNMDEGVFVEWLKPDGAAVRPGDALFKLEGEKAVEEVECLDDIFRGPLFAGVRYPLQSHRARAGKDIGKFRWRVSNLGRIKADADNPVEPRFGIGKRGQSRFFVEMAQEAEDQVRGQIKAGAGFPYTGEQPARDHAEGNTARGVGLRVEENLGVADIVRGGSFEIGDCKIAEILFGLEHASARIIDVEKVLQARETICRAHLLDGPERNVGLVALCESEHEFRLETALDVQVQFGFRHGRDQDIMTGHWVSHGEK